MNVIEYTDMEKEKQSNAVVEIEERRKAMKMHKRMKKKLRKYKNKAKAKEVINSEKVVSNGNNATAKQSEQELNNSSVILNKKQPQNQTASVEYLIPAIDLSFFNHCDKNTILQFSKVLDRFNLCNNNTIENSNKIDDKEIEKTEIKTPDIIETNSSDINKDVSKKKRRKRNRFTVDELKELAIVPQVVEPWDVSAAEPLLVVDLKSCRNSVPVPSHWRYPEKFLNSHYSELRLPYELPDFIKDTGIMESRDRLKKQEAAKRSKTKRNQMRRPKIGKLDLEYEALYDAFFKYQTKPKLTIYGDLYEEKKVISSKFNNKIYGDLSNELKEALGMKSHITPPPWLYQMQRYGPPPSYQYVNIPGLNSPIPEGAEWGYQNNGWGKFPVDEFNRPLYGNPYNNKQTIEESEMPQLNRQLWGELECENTDNDDSDDENENDNVSNHAIISSDSRNKNVDDDDITFKSTNIDMQEELYRSKKQKHIHHNNKEVNIPPKLYEIIPSKTTITDAVGLFGSQHSYDTDKLQIKNTGYLWNSTTKDVTISLDPNDLSDKHGLDKNVIRNKYQSAQKERMPNGVGEKELTNMYTDYAKRQAMKLRQKEDKKKIFKF